MLIFGTLIDIDKTWVKVIGQIQGHSENLNCNHFFKQITSHVDNTDNSSGLTMLSRGLSALAEPLVRHRANKDASTNAQTTRIHNVSGTLITALRYNKHGIYLRFYGPPDRNRRQIST